MLAAMVTVSEPRRSSRRSRRNRRRLPVQPDGDPRSRSTSRPKTDRNLAANLLNANGGVLGRPVKLIVEDGKSDLTTISNICKKMVDEDKVIALVGLTDTDYMRAGGRWPRRRGLPFLDVGGTAPIITQIGDYIFMLPFGDNVQAAAGAEFAQEKGWKTCAMLVDDAMSLHQVPGAVFQRALHDGRHRWPGGQGAELPDR